MGMDPLLLDSNGKGGFHIWVIFDQPMMVNSVRKFVEQSVERGVDERTAELLDAYAEGVNAALSKRGPWELRLLGYRPEPWRASDCLLLARMAGYLTLAQSQAEIERLYLEMVQAGIADDKLQALFPDRDIVLTDTRELWYNGGAVHCVTNDQPSLFDDE